VNTQATRWRKLLLQVLTYGVAVHGVAMIASTLDDQLRVRIAGHLLHVSGIAFDLPIVFGLTLLYLSALLRRRKRTAWAVTLGVYGFIVAGSLVRLALAGPPRPFSGLRDALLVLPLLAVIGLLYFRGDFTVKSDVRSFAFSLRFIVLVLAVALVYGVTGFILMDKRDFHEEISFSTAIHRTVDQFDLTTTHSLTPYTRRAKVFVNSLSVISVGAVAYAAVSLFQPIRARLTDQTAQRDLARELLTRWHGNSEDFFKLWPHDKLYFFNLAHTAGVAYSVHRGVALVVGDPFGDPSAFPGLLAGFEEYCRSNDWATAFIHTAPPHSKLYKDAGYTLQKIGEEAVLDIAHFRHEVAVSKYFRQIRNKFTKQGYTTDVLQPPHNADVLRRLHNVSNAWLQQPGRSERSFMMGYFTPAYMQQGPVMVLRDAAGTIQAFINQVPSYDPKEANFDFLRHTNEALGNANDFLLMQFIEYAHEQGFERVNLGLCPLAGLDAHDEERSVVDSALRFLYANGDRFYSFSGLHRFKSKYDPAWSSRYIAYRGGLRGFTRVLNALNRALRV
jgi:phosphatidylglycerol lysyltransferase